MCFPVSSTNTKSISVTVLQRTKQLWGMVGSVSRCRWCAATATVLLSVHVFSVSKGEVGEIERLVPTILRARPVRWVSLRSCTAYSA